MLIEQLYGIFATDNIIAKELTLYVVVLMTVGVVIYDILCDFPYKNYDCTSTNNKKNCYGGG